MSKFKFYHTYRRCRYNYSSKSEPASGDRCQKTVRGKRMEAEEGSGASRMQWNGRRQGCGTAPWWARWLLGGPGLVAILGRASAKPEERRSVGLSRRRAMLCQFTKSFRRSCHMKTED
ncbi:hypothetical protein UPYG_G00023720 [Umbra pygmaea]|uniref:Uncharacterized protein n=1 Tax=Umbra pygmaea TaxID=75934 RepID=A0ABD0XLC0_UMBPY